MNREQLKGNILQILTESQLGQEGITLLDKFTMEEIYELGDAVIAAFPKTPLEQVEQFHTTFKQPVIDRPDIPSAARVRLRLNLIFEELYELAVASGQELDFYIKLAKFVSEKGEKDDFKHEVDIIECLDALADLEYVVMGSVLELGFRDIFYTGFNLVHESNMSKVAPSLTAAEETIKDRKVNRNEHCYLQANLDGGYLIYRQADDKLIKPLTYQPVNLGDLVLEARNVED